MTVDGVSMFHVCYIKIYSPNRYIFFHRKFNTYLGKMGVVDHSNTPSSKAYFRCWSWMRIEKIGSSW